MRAQLDHIVVCASSLEHGADHVAAALGLPLAGGGAHLTMGTHNRLIGLGESDYLEVIAPNPDGPAPTRPRLFDLDNYSGAPRLTNWVMRVDDLDAALREAPDGIGAAMALSRGDYRWQMAVPDDGKLPFDGMFPSFIEWHTDPPAPKLPDLGASLISLTINHPQAGALGWALAPYLDDDRVLIHAGPVGRRAVIQTPEGEKVLA